MNSVSIFIFCGKNLLFYAKITSSRKKFASKLSFKQSSRAFICVVTSVYCVSMYSNIDYTVHDSLTIMVKRIELKISIKMSRHPVFGQKINKMLKL